jgi:hypothetical protein
MTGICAGQNWVTTDPLGLGGLLADAYKLAQLIAHHSLQQVDLLETLLDASLVGLQAYASQDLLQLPVDFRLAFREVGLSIGLRAVERLQTLVKENPGLFEARVPLHSRLEALRHYTPLPLPCRCSRSIRWRLHQTSPLAAAGKGRSASATRPIFLF